ncbi:MULTISPECIES: hypothetical protein [Rhizobium]|uniref:hypothetical protein n=1 Tax=Rhizobium TaxID=379 RepID=UPI000987030A|nr:MULTISPECIES: hypothetical protein [Rhizobium]NTF42078.1 hypothetical protein [Rhizobium rhizogenes]TIX89039.1 hypothetical protein BSK43_020645 [Rhizobium sp. P44RR-XXIV]
MTSRAILLMSLASLTVAGSLGLASSASALTMKECSAKYQAAKTAGTLNGQKWNDFRATQCSADASATTTAPATTAPAATTPAKPAKTTAAAKVDASEPDATKPPATEPAKPTMAAPAGVSFPASIDPKYASDTPGKGRFHTCVDAYNANKAKNSLGGLKWIQKGGGYYSLCNSKLKG